MRNLLSISELIRSFDLRSRRVKDLRLSYWTAMKGKSVAFSHGRLVDNISFLLGMFYQKLSSHFFILFWSKVGFERWIRHLQFCIKVPQIRHEEIASLSRTVLHRNFCSWNNVSNKWCRFSWRIQIKFKKVLTLCKNNSNRANFKVFNS